MENLIINNVKRTGQEPVGKPVMSTLVLPGDCIILPVVVSGILLMEPVVPPLRPLDVRPTIK